MLIVSKQMGTYHYDVQAAILRDRLSRAGFFVSQSFVFWLDGKPPLAPIAYPAKCIDGETFP